MGRVFVFWYKLVIAFIGIVVAGVTVASVLIWWCSAVSVLFLCIY